jgi:NAD(P)-dependent dehydrogenase (short-subunit alcohol dehydrogenase family)
MEAQTDGPDEASGRTALVTGAGSGMGRASALALCDAGYNVLAGDLDLEAVSETSAAAPSGSGQIKATQVDVSDRGAVRAFVDEALTSFGSIDLSFNCAGVGGAGTLVADTTEDHVRTIVDVNLLGVWHCMAEEISAMTRTGASGLVINMGSAMGLRDASGSAAYGMSKAAVIHMSRSAAVEYAAHGIRVIALCPGPVRTAMYQRLPDEVQQKIASGVPLGRPAEPEEIARAVVWLASPDAAYMTGSTFTLDGGDAA